MATTTPMTARLSETLSSTIKLALGDDSIPLFLTATIVVVIGLAAAHSFIALASMVQEASVKKRVSRGPVEIKRGSRRVVLMTLHERAWQTPQTSAAQRKRVKARQAFSLCVPLFFLLKVLARLVAALGDKKENLGGELLHR